MPSLMGKRDVPKEYTFSVHWAADDLGSSHGAEVTMTTRDHGTLCGTIESDGEGHWLSRRDGSTAKVYPGFSSPAAAALYLAAVTLEEEDGS